MISVSLEQARRLAVVKQRLGAKRARPTAAGIRDVARSIRCIQVDPIRAVERTQYLVLHSRIGAYDPAVFDSLVWDERFFFYYWGHAASYVLTEDLPIHQRRMRLYRGRTTTWGRRINDWMDENKGLRNHVLRELRKRGPLRIRDLEDRSVTSWSSKGWTNDRNIDRMLEFLWIQGKVLPVGRTGLERIWGLADDWLPPVDPADRLTTRRATERAACFSLLALGVATQRQIKAHFTRDDYPDLTRVLATLVKRGEILPADVEGRKGKWFIHRDDVDLVRRLDDSATPRTTLLSPFDNLICDRARTEALWDFHYRIEIYVPRDQRRYGYYALPILHGDRLIGAVDATTDRKSNVLRVDAVHLEEGEKPSAETGAGVMAALSELSGFVAGGNLAMARGAAPTGWQKYLKGA